MSRQYSNRCFGYGQHEGKCHNLASRGHLCDLCDAIRRKAITPKFDEIGSALRPGGPGRRTRLKIGDSI